MVGHCHRAVPMRYPGGKNWTFVPSVAGMLFYLVAFQCDTKYETV